LSKNEKVKHHIKMKTHKLIALRFWVKIGVNPLCVGWAHVSLILYLLGHPLLKDLTDFTRLGPVGFFSTLKLLVSVSSSLFCFMHFIILHIIYLGKNWHGFASACLSVNFEIFPTIGIRIEGLCGDRFRQVHVSKVFLTLGQVCVSR